MTARLSLLILALFTPGLLAYSRQDPDTSMGFFIQNMKKWPGCIGFEQTTLPGQRLALFAWFRDSDSANSFIGSPLCQAMRQMAQAPDSALPTIPVIKSPVLLVASFTPSKKADAPMMVDQVAVERMLPLAGGFAYGGRFTPQSVEVPGLTFQPRPADAPEGATPASGSVLDSSNLVAALKKSPGCYQVNTMQSAGGKQTLVAWFVNKKSALAWYESSPQNKLISSLPTPVKAPLAEIPENTAPVVVFASLTPSKTVDPYLKMPFSQLAVELYTTLGGGFSRGGRFNPPLPRK